MLNDLTGTSGIKQQAGIGCSTGNRDHRIPCSRLNIIVRTYWVPLQSQSTFLRMARPWRGTLSLWTASDTIHVQFSMAVGNITLEAVNRCVKTWFWPRILHLALTGSFNISWTSDHSFFAASQLYFFLHYVGIWRLSWRNVISWNISPFWWSLRRIAFTAFVVNKTWSNSFPSVFLRHSDIKSS